MDGIFVLLFISLKNSISAEMSVNDHWFYASLAQKSGVSLRFKHFGAGDIWCVFAECV